MTGALVLLLASNALASHPQQHPQHCSLVHKAWSPARWRRGQPKASTIEALRRCSNWAKAKRRYYRVRFRLLFRERVTPFHCSDAEMTFDGGWYAIPCVNVNAESGGRGGWTRDIYGLIDPTWDQYGGLAYAPTACSASWRDQDRVAAAVWRSVGSAAWTPFEG